MASNNLAMIQRNGRPPVIRLKPLDHCNRSSLLSRRTSRGSMQPIEHFGEMPFDQHNRSSYHGPGKQQQYVCGKCHEGLLPESEMLQSGGQYYHRKCFVCVQCFQPLEDGVYYEFENRRYCSHDFNILFAPSCSKCNEFIVGRVIRAMNTAWHPECFVCEICTAPLSEAGFIRNAHRALCRECNAIEKAKSSGRHVCFKCRSAIDEQPLRYKSEVYHPYHFNCSICSTELNSDAREANGELLCLRCFDRTKVPICAACRRPVEERIIHALGKTWHTEHFVCAMCEKPFHGTRHYEKGDKAYCELHYYQLLGNTCFVCNSVISGEVFTALNKAWCINHFACTLCDKKLSVKTKFYDFDKKPACKTCYKKLPSELRKRLKKDAQPSTKKKK